MQQKKWNSGCYFDCKIKTVDQSVSEFNIALKLGTFGSLHVYKQVFSMKEQRLNENSFDMNKNETLPDDIMRVLHWTYICDIYLWTIYGLK